MKMKTTNKGETCTPIEDTPRQKCYKKLMQLKKTEIADLASGLITILNHRAPDDGSYYNGGWNDCQTYTLRRMQALKYWSHD